MTKIMLTVTNNSTNWARGPNLSLFSFLHFFLFLSPNPNPRTWPEALHLFLLHARASWLKSKSSIKRRSNRVTEARCRRKPIWTVRSSTWCSASRCRRRRLRISVSKLGRFLSRSGTYNRSSVRSPFAAIFMDSFMISSSSSGLAAKLLILITFSWEITSVSCFFNRFALRFQYHFCWRAMSRILTDSSLCWFLGDLFYYYNRLVD